MSALFAETSPMAASFHPLAEIFPLLEGDEFDALAADIKAHGLHEPIVEFEHAILDGRNRYRACIAAGVEPRFVSVHTDDPLGYVMSANLHRRHLNETQRGMVASRVANLGHGQKRADAPRGTTAATQSDAARGLVVSRRTIQRCKVVLTSGVPELVHHVDRGDISAATAAKVARLPDDEQRKLVGLKESEVRTALKRHVREEREVALSEATAKASAVLGLQLYPVIYADPPWRFAPWAPSGMDRAADNHYPTLTTDALCALSPPAAPDCVLFLWATAPMLLDALDVMEAWGFEYRSQICWVKSRAGTGYWTRNRHELLLIGVKGDVPAPAPGEQFESVQEFDSGEHSAKPHAFAEIIEAMFPTCKLLEMFARGPRVGWTVWGNEAERVGAM